MIHTQLLEGVGGKHEAQALTPSPSLLYYSLCLDAGPRLFWHPNGIGTKPEAIPSRDMGGRDRCGMVWGAGFPKHT